MTQFDTNKKQTQRPLVAKLLLLLGITLLFMAVGSGIGLVLFEGMAGVPFATFQLSPSSYPQAWYATMLLQMLSTPLTFIGASLFYWVIVEKQATTELSFRSTDSHLLIVIALLVVGFMPFDGLFIEWNKNIHLPESMKALEAWMKASEDAAAELTKFLTAFDTPLRFGVGMLVVAVAAGVSEELLFRGVMQNLLLKAWKNPHWAIWVAAFWFSFIHFQFYGFIPRMLLGAMFGYLYHWTKNLWVSIFAHFINNGFTLFMVYLYQIKVTNTDIEKVEDVPLMGAITSFIITVGILYWVYTFHRKENHTHNERLEENL